jgi:hypothetical protein
MRGKGYRFCPGTVDDAIFLVLANASAKQGVLMLEIKRIIGELKLLLM